jgi:hypothetical protein
MHFYQSLKTADISIPALVHEIPLANTYFQCKRNTEDQELLMYYSV